MAIQLDLAKSKERLKLDLTKAGIAPDLQVEICFDLDVSGSYEDLHNDGTTERLVARLAPWGLVLDPDKKLDVFTFSDGDTHVHHVGFVDETNYNGFVRERIIDRVPGWRGGTDYAPVLKRNLEHFGWVQTHVSSVHPKQGFLSGLFGRRSRTVAQSPVEAVRRKSLVLFNTDGDNSDEHETIRLFRRMQDERLGVYVVFIAVRQSKRDNFSFIRRLADEYSNCGLLVIENISEWVHLPDSDINQQILTDELVQWLKN
jgi:hypothetical protein